MLTREQVDFFHANGYLIMRGLLKGEELSRLRAAADAVQAQGEAKTGEDHLYSAGPDGDPVYWRSERIWDRNPIFMAVTVNPEILENIGQCMGMPFYPWNDSLVVKLARKGASVFWHQDPPYMGAQRDETYPVPNFTTDLYLDHSGPDNGCVWAIPGHHLVGGVKLDDKTMDQLIGNYGAHPVEMEAGDVLFHCLSTPHGSRANTSDIQRRIFYIHYVNQEAYDDFTSGFQLPGKSSWGETKKAQILEMVERRREFGWETPDGRATLAFGEGGYTVTGLPTVPERYWGQLAAQIPADRKAAMKRLEPRR